MFRNLQIDSRWLIIWFALLIGGLAVPQLEGIVLCYVAVRALKSTKATLEALLVLAFYLLGNEIFTAGFASNLRYLILFFGFLSVMFRKSSGRNSLRTMLWVFFMIATLSSLFASYLPTISTLKVVSFFVGTYVMVEGFAQTRKYRTYWLKTMNTFFVFILLSSTLFLFLGLGFERNGRGFQGIMAHPQTFGPILSVITAWFLGMWASGSKKYNGLLLLPAISILYIFLSQARTGIAALTLSSMFAFLLSKQTVVNLRLKRKVRSLLLGLGIAVILSLVIYPQFITDTILPFVQKREATTTDFNELFNQSRGGLAVSSMDNFRSHPLLGIGLGVPSDAPSGESMIQIKYISGIPVGASVEKGFLPSAILEEMGAIGMALTLLILLVLFRKVRQASFFTLWIVAAALFINIGEAVLYSLGGPGFFVWMIFALGYSYDLFKQQPRTLP